MSDGPAAAKRALRLGNPIALFGVVGVGLAAMLVPDVVLYVAIEQGAAPEIDAIRAGADVPFPVLAATLLVRQSILLFGALAIAWLATSARPRGEDRPRAASQLGFASAPSLAVAAGAIGIVGLGPSSDFMIRLLRSIAPGLEMGVLEEIADIAAAQPTYVLWPLLALLPGIAEEAYFRGLVQGVLGRGGRAIVGSGVVFAIFHLDPMQAAGVLPVGLYLAWLRDRTGSLWVPIAAHVTNNTAALVAARALPLVEPAGTTEPTAPHVAALGLAWTFAAMFAVHRAMAGRR